MSDHSVEAVVLAFEEDWRHGPPRIERYYSMLSVEDSTLGLAELVRIDMKQRFRRGERPSAREYFDRFPELTGEDDHAVSLIFEEFILRDEAGERVDSAEFRDRYETWGKSFDSQLDCYDKLKQLAGPLPPAPKFPKKGDCFGDYHLVELLGTGGMGVVFLAETINLGGKKVALKITRDRGTESAVLGKLNHAHIVEVYATFVDPETGFRGICMQYQPGMPLNEVLQQFSRTAIPRSASELRKAVDPNFLDLPTENGRRSGWDDFPSGATYADGVAWVGWKLAGALDHAHSKGIYHRDVKPDNLLLTRRGGPQLLDFNLAHDSFAAEQARAALLGGTLPYMAPEQLQASLGRTLWKDVGARADLFSLGMILREMLILKAPAKPAANLSIYRAIDNLIPKQAVPQTPIRDFNPKVPHALKAIVDKCLAAAPKDRYASAQELADDLDCFLHRRALKVAVNPSRIEIACNQAHRQARFAIVAVAVALFVGLIALAASVDRRPKPVPARAPVPAAITLEVPTPETRERIQNAWKALEQRDLARSDLLFDTALKRPDAMRAFEVESQGSKNRLGFTLAFGRALCRVDRLAEGETVYRRATELDPSSSNAFHGYATSQMRPGKYDSALTNIDHAVELFRGDRSSTMKYQANMIRLNRVMILLQLGDPAKDKADLTKARDFINRAIADLAFIEANIDASTPAPFVSNFHHAYAVAKTSLGDLASSLGEFQVARGCFQAALNHAKAARETGGDDSTIIDKLAEKIKQIERKHTVP